MAGIVIGEGNPAGLGARGPGRHPELIHQELADVQGFGRQGGNPFLERRFGVGHHQRPELLDGGTAGGAGGDQIIAGRGGVVQEVQVEADQMPKSLGIAAGQGRNAAAALAGGEPDPHPVVRQNREHRVPHLGIDLVDEAAHEKGHLKAAGPGGGVEAGDLDVPGGWRQGFEVAVGQQRRHEPGAGGAQEVVHRLDKNPLEPGAPGHEAVEPGRLAEETAE